MMSSQSTHVAAVYASLTLVWFCGHGLYLLLLTLAMMGSTAAHILALRPSPTSVLVYSLMTPASTSPTVL